MCMHFLFREVWEWCNFYRVSSDWLSADAKEEVWEWCNFYRVSSWGAEKPHATNVWEWCNFYRVSSIIREMEKRIVSWNARCNTIDVAKVPTFPLRRECIWKCRCTKENRLFQIPRYIQEEFNKCKASENKLFWILGCVRVKRNKCWASDIKLLCGPPYVMLYKEWVSGVG